MKILSPHGGPYALEDILVKLKAGYQFRWNKWPSEKLFMATYDPRQASNSQEKMTEPYLYLYTADGRLTPYALSNEELLGNHWVRVE